MGVDADRIDAVQRYLVGKFPAYRVQTFFDDWSRSQIFRIVDNGTAHVVKVSHYFLMGNSPGEIARKLARWDLASVLTVSEPSPVLVMSDGIHPD
jgi:hypothetical protein